MPHLQREGRCIMPTWAMTECQQCGASIDQASKGRPRRFCSAACKQAAYRASVTKVNRTGCEHSEGPITHGAGETSSAANPGKPAKAVRA